jgi:hypothetical protein
MLKIAYVEEELQQKVKEAGGVWSVSRSLWKVPYKIACQMKLEKRIVVEKKGAMQAREKA